MFQTTVSDEVDAFVDGVRNGVSSALQSAIEFLPNLIGAILILVVGWFVARLIKAGFERFFKAVGLDRLLARAGLTDTLERAGYSASSLAARVVYWIALLVVFLMASQTLEIANLSELLTSLIAFLPLLVVAIIIVIVAAALGAFLADLVRPYGDRQQISWLASAVRFAMIAFGVFAALNTVNVAEEIVNTLFIAIVATLGVTVAVSFGVGGIQAARGWWERTLPPAGE